MALASRVAAHSHRRFGHLVSLVAPSCLEPPSSSATLSARTRRTFATSDGPFRHMKVKFTDRNRKKNYNEVLVTGDVKKLVDTAQDMLQEHGSKVVPDPVWKQYAKRCVASMHLLKPLELAIIARCFDAYDIDLKGAEFNVFGSLAKQLRETAAQKDFPGLAVLVLADVVARRLQNGKNSKEELLDLLGRKACQCMWELSPSNAVEVLTSVTSAGALHPTLCTRVARKVQSQLETLPLGVLAKTAKALAAQEHRDLSLLQGIAHRVCAEGKGYPHSQQCAEDVLSAFQQLDIDGAPEELKALASGAGLRAESYAADSVEEVDVDVPQGSDPRAMRDSQSSP